MRMRLSISLLGAFMVWREGKAGLFAPPVVDFPFGDPVLLDGFHPCPMVDPSGMNSVEARGHRGRLGFARLDCGGLDYIHENTPNTPFTTVCMP